MTHVGKWLKISPCLIIKDLKTTDLLLLSTIIEDNFKNGATKITETHIVYR